MTIRVEHGDCLEVMPRLCAEGVQVDSIVCDPPYHLTSIVKRFSKSHMNHKPDKDLSTIMGPAFKRLAKGFMGKEWDGGDVAFRAETWEAALALIKPGGHLIAFSGTRTYHRMACAIEDAGFEIRDQLAWCYGSGFPKSHNAGNGWGTALKPAWEPIVLARKPLIGTVAKNMAEHGTGALNIDGCRIENPDFDPSKMQRQQSNRQTWGGGTKSGFAADHEQTTYSEKGRWPANILHDGSDEVLAAFPQSAGQQGVVTGNERSSPFANVYGHMPYRNGSAIPRGDAGSAARFFYSSKADADDRLDSKHPTVKPTDLMAYLCRLVTSPGGLVLDPFAGSGSTGMACLREGFNAILIEREDEYVADIRRRLAHVEGADTPLFGGLAA